MFATFLHGYYPPPLLIALLIFGSSNTPVKTTVAQQVPCITNTAPVQIAPTFAVDGQAASSTQVAVSVQPSATPCPDYLSGIRPLAASATPTSTIQIAPTFANFDEALPGIFDPNSGVFSLGEYGVDSTPVGGIKHQFVYGSGNSSLVPILPGFVQYYSSVGVYNPQNAAFLLRCENSSGAADVSFLYGPTPSAPGQIIPLMGDWNGDGLRTQGIYVKTTSVFILSDTLNGAPNYSFPFGDPNDGPYIPVVSDWDRNGTETVGLYRPANSTWYLINSNASIAPNSYITFNPVGAGGIPVPNLLNARSLGMYDPATGRFWWRYSVAGTPMSRYVEFGPPGNVPIAGRWATNRRSAYVIIGHGTKTWTLDEEEAIHAGVRQVGVAMNGVLQNKRTCWQDAFNRTMIEQSGTEILFIRTNQSGSITVSNYTIQRGSNAGTVGTYTYANVLPNECVALREVITPAFRPAAIICSGDLTDHYSGTVLTKRADVYTVVHELGHILDYKTGPNPQIYGLSKPIDGGFTLTDCNTPTGLVLGYSNVTTSWTRGPRGWGTGPAYYLDNGNLRNLITTFQQNPQNTAVEAAADSFLNWVFRSNVAGNVVVSSKCSQVPNFGTGFQNLAWATAAPAFVANSAGLTGTPDASLPGDSRYLDFDQRIRSIASSKGW